MKLVQIKTRERNTDNALVDREAIINPDMITTITRQVKDGPYILGLSGTDDLLIPVETVRQLLALD
jgi:hypothetical protein